ncbi:hypothetical protein B0H19DRAFT_1245476 [Mycena capillaripes]|nr:hypothetical protein B0H19DRAFT_1245476 [Mycena capillaripes]
MRPPPASIPFQSVVVADVDGSAPSHVLRLTALDYMKKAGSNYIEIPHDPKPVNEFNNPHMFPMVYPTQFPYGLGGLEDKNPRTVSVSSGASSISSTLLIVDFKSITRSFSRLSFSSLPLLMLDILLMAGRHAIKSATYGTDNAAIRNRNIAQGSHYRFMEIEPFPDEPSQHFRDRLYPRLNVLIGQVESVNTLVGVYLHL